MVQLLLSPSGWGKTTFIYNSIRRDISDGKKVMLIVPDQEAVSAEASCADITSDIPSTELYVCSFSRLCNDAFRKYGGIAYNYTDKTTGRLLLYTASRSISEYLKVYSGLAAADSSIISSIFSTVSELKRNGISADELYKASETVTDDNSRLKDKLSDIALIFDAYNSNLGSALSDPSDDMTKLISLLEQHDMFGEYDSVYIDSFYFFTSMQYKVIGHIFKQCGNVVISLCTSSQKADIGFSLSICEYTKNKLTAIADDKGKRLVLTDLDFPARFKNNALKHLEYSLRSDSSEQECVENEVKTVVCNTPFDEAEYAAVQICKKIRAENKRYRNFAVAVANTDEWKGIIDAVFEKFNIPFFISSRTDIMQKPFIKLVFSALNVHNSGFYREDVISYIKTGLAGLSYKDTDLFSAYVKRWGITGKRFYAEGWEMNPYGYSARFTDNERQMLDHINRIRDYVITPLYDLSSALTSDGLTCKKISELIYDLLLKINVKKQLENEILSCDDDGERSELYQIWHLFFKACDDLSSVCGDNTVSVTEYIALLSMVLSEIDIGKIPTSQDQVVIGDIGRLRTENPDCIFILGVNEGDIPSKVSSPTVFSFSDIKELVCHGISLENDGEMYMRNSFEFYKTATCSRENVYITRCRRDTDNTQKSPSPFFTKIEKLFPKGREIYDGMKADDIYTLACAVDLYGRILPTDQSEAIKHHLAEDPNTEHMTVKYDRVHRLSENAARELYSGDLKLSQSKIGEFKRCKFKYYCNYVLGLKNDKEIDIESNDLGTYVHYILQRLMQMYISGDITEDIEYGLLCDHIHTFTEEFTKAYLNADLTKSGYQRIRSLFTRIEKRTVKSAQNLLCELSATQFKPVKLEYHISDNSETKALHIPLSDGTNAVLGGIADRIDTFDEDGNTYIKIVDYKTSKVAFSLEDLQQCENIQLFVYMISICQSDNGAFGKNVKPAAVFYINTMPTIADHSKSVTAQRADDDAKASITRSGAVISDEKIKNAVLGDGTVFKAAVGKQVSFITDEEFSEAFDSLKASLGELADIMKSGKADACPKIMPNNKIACEYCEYKAICRYESKTVEDDE